MYCSSFDKIYDITACCGDIYGRCCNQKRNNDHSTYNLPLSSLRWKVLHFFSSRINKVDRDFMYWQFFFTCLPPVKPRDIAFIPSRLEGVQRWRVSWIRSISQETAGRGKELTLSFQGGFIAWVHETLYAGYRVSPAKNNCNRHENHYY